MGTEAAQVARSLLQALRGVMCQLAEPSAVLRTILEQAVAQTGAQRGLLVEVAAGGGLTYQVLHGFAPRHFDGDAGSFSRHIFRRVLEERRAVLLANTLDDASVRDVESVRALRVSAILCVPIEAEGRIAALVHLEHPEPGHFRDEHLDTLRPLVEIAGSVLEALRASQQVTAERDRLRDAESVLRDEAEESRHALAADWSFGRFVGRSAVVRELGAAVRKAAATEFPVLIQGETGTGKGIVARVLHYAGPRAAAPFITVFCPSLERGMVEAELFGHRRGAFTGAESDRPGKVQAAEGGSLFLDEIGELPPEIQPRLLRLLQEHTYERLGDARERRADARIIAASNRDLEREVQAGRFRRDLYERLNFVPLRTPPLRAHPEDIALLLRHCLDQHEGGRWRDLTPEAASFLEHLPFAWPGNVRHLEQLAARLTMEGLRGPVTAVDLTRLLGERPAVPRRAVGEEAGAAGAELEEGLPRLLEEAERAWLEEALRRYPELTRAEIAAKLKISESALYKKLKQHGLHG
jgi:transcriptional regulator with GAF, ATPase, and Fis domain